MVNYCCVKGCGRNSKQSSHLNYYSLPKDLHRQKQWLEAAGREDLWEKSNTNSQKLTYRVCSRHFASSCIKNRNLSSDAVPTLCLPGSKSEDNNDKPPVQHTDIMCNNCRNLILGFRYKCVSCPDYDLCPKCEMMETHAHHYVLRVPKPVKFKILDNLITNWRDFFKEYHIQTEIRNDSDSSGDSDDEPIVKYAKRYDSGVDLSEDVKLSVREEVARVLSEKRKQKKRNKTVSEKNDLGLGKRGNPSPDTVNTVKKQKVPSTSQLSLSTAQTLETDEPSSMEVAFADVNEITATPLDVKEEAPPPLVSDIEESAITQPMMHVRLSDDFTELMIEMTQNGTKTLYKYTD